MEGLVCPEWIEEHNGRRELTVGKIQWVGWKYYQERLTHRGCYTGLSGESDMLGEVEV